MRMKIISEANTSKAELVKIATSLIRKVANFKEMKNVDIGFKTKKYHDIEQQFSVNIIFFDEKDNSHVVLYGFYSLEKNKEMADKAIQAIKANDLIAFRKIGAR